MTNVKDIRDFFANIKPGTPQAAVLYGIAGLVIALLLLFIGFWKTLLVLACVGVGIFIGGVPDKRGFFHKVLGRFFPSDN